MATGLWSLIISLRRLINEQACSVRCPSECLGGTGFGTPRQTWSILGVITVNLLSPLVHLD